MALEKINNLTVILIAVARLRARQELLNVGY